MGPCDGSFTSAPGDDGWNPRDSWEGRPHQRDTAHCKDSPQTTLFAPVYLKSMPSAVNPKHRNVLQTELGEPGARGGSRRTPLPEGWRPEQPLDCLPVSVLGQVTSPHLPRGGASPGPWYPKPSAPHFSSSSSPQRQTCTSAFGHSSCLQDVLPKTPPVPTVSPTALSSRGAVPTLRRPPRHTEVMKAAPCFLSSPGTAARSPGHPGALLSGRLPAPGPTHLERDTQDSTRLGTARTAAVIVGGGGLGAPRVHTEGARKTCACFKRKLC